jgi:hypothetical protein
MAMLKSFIVAEDSPVLVAVLMAMLVLVGMRVLVLV